MYAISVMSLLASKAKGFFFLRGLLADFATPLGVEAIFNKAYLEHDVAVKKTGITSFTPTFQFTELPPNGTQRRVRMAMNRDEEGRPLEQIAHLDLVIVIDTASDCEVLELDRSAVSP